VSQRSHTVVANDEATARRCYAETERDFCIVALIVVTPMCSSAVIYSKDLDGWQSWVLQDRPFLRCPFFANTDGALKENRVCALPGRLTLELTQSGGRFAQSWLTFSEGWVPLPGNLDNWPPRCQ